ncbi:MAG TPA: hypothetical protein VLX29_03065 [Nitrospirota bacterium]|nr:hypothetical protein [Nitrospirota bacterium]
MGNLPEYLFATVSAGLGAFLGAYLKKYGEETALKDSFEDFKKRLQQTTSLTEEIKSKIGIDSIEHQIKYSRLHEKRIAVIEKLYQLIVTMEQTGRSFVYSAGPTQQPSEEFKKASAAIEEFINYSKLNQFWVDKELFDEIEKVALRIDKIVHESMFNCNINPQDTVKFSEAMAKNRLAVDEITKEIPKAKENIINSIRHVLDPTITKKII